MANLQFSSSTASYAGGAVSDLFAGEGDLSKATGDRIQAQDYGLASDLATQNEKFTETSTAIKEAQINRQNVNLIGTEQADVAGAGFSSSGSALDIMRDAAGQGALTHAVAQEQGLITEAGYDEQAQSFKNMQEAANNAANAEDNAATGSWITAGLKGVAAVASIFAAPLTGGLSLAGLAAVGDPATGG
jgi:hypothetical protein